MQVLHYKHNSQEVHLHLCMHFCSWYACIFVAGMHAFLWLVSIPLRVVGIFSLRIFCKGFILSKNSSVHKHWSKSVTSPSATFSKTEQNKTNYNWKWNLIAFLPTNPLHSLKISHSTDEENLFDDQGLLKLVIISFILISHILMKG